MMMLPISYLSTVQKEQFSEFDFLNNTIIGTNGTSYFRANFLNSKCQIHGRQYGLSWQVGRYCLAKVIPKWSELTRKSADFRFDGPKSGPVLS